jgi:hypothetical protein
VQITYSGHFPSRIAQKYLIFRSAWRSTGPAIPGCTDLRWGSDQSPALTQLVKGEDQFTFGNSLKYFNSRDWLLVDDVDGFNVCAADGGWGLFKTKIQVCIATPATPKTRSATT